MLQKFKETVRGLESTHSVLYSEAVTLPKRTKYGLWSRNSVFVLLMLASLSLYHVERFRCQVTDIELNCLDNEGQSWLTQLESC